MSRYWKIYVMICFAIALELISPIPLLLSFGALFVILMKPQWFLFFVRRLYEVDRAEEVERLVIECARRYKNRLTVTELAAETHLNLQQAEGLLNRLEDDGRISSSVSESGVIIYDFNELLPHVKEKNELEA